MTLGRNGYVQPVEILQAGIGPARNGWVQPVEVVGTGGGNLVQESGSTTDSFVEVFTEASIFGLFGIGTILNTGAEDMNVRETVTDLFGNTVSKTTLVPAGDSYILDLQTNFSGVGTAYPPYSSYEVEVESASPGLSTTYDLNFIDMGPGAGGGGGGGSESLEQARAIGDTFTGGDVYWDDAKGAVFGIASGEADQDYLKIYSDKTNHLQVFDSTKDGTGTIRSMSWQMGGTQRMSLSSSGALSLYDGSGNMFMDASAANKGVLVLGGIGYGFAVRRTTNTQGTPGYSWQESTGSDTWDMDADSTVGGTTFANAQGTNVYLKSSTGTGNFYVLVGGSDTLGLYVQSTGNVGVGTTPSGYQLHVARDSDNALLTLQRTGTIPGQFSFLLVNNDGVGADLAIYNVPGARTVATFYRGGAVNIPGDVSIGGKLTVTGAIDPTSISLAGSTEGAQVLYIDSADGKNTSTAASGHGRLRYNNTTKTWQQSVDGGSWSSLGGGGTPLTVTDGNTSVSSVSTITFNAFLFTVTDGGSGDAQVTLASGTDIWFEGLGYVYLNPLFQTDAVTIGATSRTSHSGDQEQLLVKKDYNASTIIRSENYDAGDNAEATLMVALAGNRGGVVLAMGANATSRGGYGAGDTVYSTYGTGNNSLALRTGEDIPIRFIVNDVERAQFNTTDGFHLETTMLTDGAITMRYDVTGTSSVIMIDNRHASGNPVIRVGNNPLGANTALTMDYSNSDNSSRVMNGTGDMSIGTTGVSKKLYLVSDAPRCIVDGNGIYPNVNNDVSCGLSSKKWSDVWTVNQHTGDLHLDDEAFDTHWTVREAKMNGEDRGSLYAIDRVTGRKYKFALEPV